MILVFLMFIHAHILMFHHQRLIQHVRNLVMELHLYLQQTTPFIVIRILTFGQMGKQMIQL